MDNFFIPFIIFLVSVFIARRMQVRAINFLSTEEKAKLLDVFAKRQMASFAFIIVLMIAFYLALKYNLLNSNYALIAYVCIAIVAAVWFSYSTVAKLKQNNFPDKYIRLVIIATLLRLAAMSVLFGWIIYSA